ncbi:1-phosphofructokinase [Escherichia coli]|uniref:1-phosphofructokinase n=1 Tax=Escherichia coli TaxID=562 RepID=A0A377CCQ6_ECOLX|nr:1-phosphofructokinase [Escherichia coli]
MSRRVATITLNPAYDLVGFCPEIERGEVNLVKNPVCMRRVKASTWPKY